MNPWRWSCFIVLLLLSPLTASSSSIIRTLPGYSGDLPFKLETGYIGVGEAEEVQLFYLFVESERNPSTDPILLWHVGGPGCSGLSAFFFENGPLVFDRSYSGNFAKLELNPYTWTKVLNMIYIDMPVGTGFSYSKTQQGYHSSDTLWVDHAYSFLQKWFSEHPEFSKNPFYIGGGSYSGIPVGPLVQKVYQGRQAKNRPLINIKGYVLGSPFVDSYWDNNVKIEYAHRMALIPDELYESLKASCNDEYININPTNIKCVSSYGTYSNLVRYINENQILEPICITTPGENQRILSENSDRILQPIQDLSAFWCRGYDHILVNNWANDEYVWKALHIRKGTKDEFQRCNKTLAYTKNLYSAVEYYQNLSHTSLQSLVYCSDLDMSVPHIGTQRWIKSLNLTIADPWRAWFVEGQVAGYTEIYKKKDYYLTYVAVKGAGHVAQTYKPKEVYNLIERWFSYSII